MNLALQLLAAAVLIAVMAGFRIFANHRVVRQRRKCDSGNGNCGKTECFHGCGIYNSDTAEE